MKLVDRLVLVEVFCDGKPTLVSGRVLEHESTYLVLDSKRRIPFAGPSEGIRNIFEQDSHQVLYHNGVVTGAYAVDGPDVRHRVLVEPYERRQVRQKGTFELQEA